MKSSLSQPTKRTMRAHARRSPLISASMPRCWTFTATRWPVDASRALCTCAIDADATGS
jgi:hypothetical protein